MPNQCKSPIPQSCDITSIINHLFVIEDKAPFHWCIPYQPPLWVSWLYRQVKSSTKCNFSIFTYIWIQLEFEKQKRKKNLTNNYYTKLLKFCCSGHWDINHPTINSPFGDSFWHRLGLMQDQHAFQLHIATTKLLINWFAHLWRDA